MACCIYCNEDIIDVAPQFVGGEPIHPMCQVDLNRDLDAAFPDDGEHCNCDSCEIDDDFEDDFDFEDDGQPTEYEEWQDLYGGDDWDHGQYDFDY